MFFPLAKRFGKDFHQILTVFEVIKDGVEMFVHFIGAHDLHKDI
jgi:hypothetical protein